MLRKPRNSNWNSSLIPVMINIFWKNLDLRSKKRRIQKGRASQEKNPNPRNQKDFCKRSI